MSATISLFDLENLLNDYANSLKGILENPSSRWRETYDANQKLIAITEIKKIIIGKMVNPASDEYNHWLKTA